MEVSSRNRFSNLFYPNKGINNHSKRNKKEKKIVKICQLKIKKNRQKIEKYGKKQISSGQVFFFFLHFEEKSGKKKLWRIQNRWIPWTGYPRSLFNRRLIVIRQVSHRSAFVPSWSSLEVTPWRDLSSVDPRKNTGSPPRNPFQVSRES